MKKYIKSIVYAVTLIAGILMFFIPNGVKIAYNNNGIIPTSKTIYGYTIRLAFFGFILIIFSLIGLFNEMYNKKLHFNLFNCPLKDKGKHGSDSEIKSNATVQLDEADEIIKPNSDDTII